MSTATFSRSCCSFLTSVSSLWKSMERRATMLLTSSILLSTCSTRVRPYTQDMNIDQPAVEGKFSHSGLGPSTTRVQHREGCGCQCILSLLQALRAVVERGDERHPNQAGKNGPELLVAAGQNRPDVHRRDGSEYLSTRHQHPWQFTTNPRDSTQPRGTWSHQCLSFIPWRRRRPPSSNMPPFN